MRLNFTANGFVFGCTNRENLPRTFYIKHARRKRPKCVWTSQQTAAFLDTCIVKLRPELFSVNLAGRELPKCVWTLEQTASFLDAQIEKMRPELFYQAGKAKTSKMRLNSTANRFVFGHINGQIAPRSFYCKPCKWRTSRMRRNFKANSFVFKYINCENAPELFS